MATSAEKRTKIPATLDEIKNHKQMEMQSTQQISPSSVSIGILVVLFCIYAAYMWYMKSKTVPVPAFYDGFAPSVMPGSGKKDVVGMALDASEWFDNPPGKPVAQEPKQPAGVPAASARGVCGSSCRAKRTRLL